MCKNVCIFEHAQFVSSVKIVVNQSVLTAYVHV